MPTQQNTVAMLIDFCRRGTDDFLRDNGHTDVTRTLVISRETFNDLRRDWIPMWEQTIGPPPILGSYRLYHMLSKRAYRIGIYEFIVSNKPEVTAGIPWPECLRTGQTESKVVSVNTSTAQGAPS